MPKDKMKAERTEEVVTRTVSRAGKVEKEDSESSQISVHKFVTEPARVSVEYSLTINLGNYESARVCIGVQVPCYKEEINDAYAFAQSWVEGRVGEEKAAITGSRDGGRNPF